MAVIRNKEYSNKKNERETLIGKFPQKSMKQLKKKQSCIV